jgi:hypothetical protein
VVSFDENPVAKNASNGEDGAPQDNCSPVVLVDQSRRPCSQCDEVKANDYCVEGFPLSYQLTILSLVSATITS